MWKFFTAEEDKKYFPQIAGSDWLKAVKFAAKNFKNESFIRQYLSPSVIRDMGLWVLTNDPAKDYYEVIAMQDITRESALQTIRDATADTFDANLQTPHIEVTEVDLRGDRMMTLTFTSFRGQELDERVVQLMLEHVLNLWEFPVGLAVKEDDLMEMVWYIDQDGNFDQCTGEPEDEEESSIIVLR